MSLLKYFMTIKCSHCRKRIEKAARYCRHCGTDNANSSRKCTACGVSVNADSQFCWSCKANLSAQPRDEFVNDCWSRTQGIFASRATIETPQDRLRHGIKIDVGTVGALYRDGTLSSELAPGYHTQTSFWDRLTAGGKTGGFVEAVICAADPVTSLVSLGDSAGIYTSDRSALEASVIIKVQLSNLDTFTRRLMPRGTDSVRDDDLMLPHSARVAEVIRRHISRLSVNDVALSVELRHELEAALGRELPDLLAEYGLIYRGIESVRLKSPDIERIHDAEGDMARREREINWEKLKRQMEDVSKLDKIKDEMALRAQVDSWSHAANLTQLEREHVIKMKNQALRHIEALQEATNTIAIKTAHDEYKNGKIGDLIGILEKISKISGNAKDAEVERDIKKARALEALHPRKEVGIVASTTRWMGETSLEQLAQRYLPAVGVVVAGMETGNPVPMGTAWVAEGRNVLITNAHVAESLAQAREHTDMDGWVIFSGQSAPCRVRHTLIHPDYAQSQSSGCKILPFDVAVLELETPAPHTGLRLASRSKTLNLLEYQTVAYLGFPMEGLAGGGANLERPKAIAKKGIISSLQDWHMRHSEDTAKRQLILHDLGVAGGASGSPLFDESGDVVGIISAGNMEKIYDPQTRSMRRMPNGVVINFAQRIDVLTDWQGW
jgi:hypothetical protein